MKSDFQKRLERIKAARPNYEDKPDFSSSPIHRANSRLTKWHLRFLVTFSA